jgi:hypothetical protein
LLQKKISGRTISHLATRQQSGDRPALAIAQGMDLRGPPTA